MEHAADGLFDNAAVTEWERGKAAEVLWKSGAKHRGTYVSIAYCGIVVMLFSSI